MSPAPPVPPDEPRRLQALRAYDILDTEPEAALDELTHLAGQICGATVALISLVDEKRQWFKANVGFNRTETPRDISFCAHALLEPGLFIVPDATQDPRFVDSPLVTGESRIRFYAGAPLLAPEGQAIGTLCVLDQQPRHLTETQQQSLKILARQVMTHLDLQRQRRELRASQAKLRAIFEAEPECVKLLSADGTVHDMNPAGLRMIEVEGFDQVRGKSLLPVVVPEQREAVLELLAAVAGGERRTGEFLIIGFQGTPHWIELNGVPFRDETTGETFILGVSHDITQRKISEGKIQRLNHLYAVSSGINEAIVRMHTPFDLYTQACRIAVERGELVMAWIGLTDEATGIIRPVARAGRDEGYLDALEIRTSADYPQGRGPAGEAFRSQKPVSLQDIDGASGGFATRTEALARGYRSCAAFPLCIEGRSVGVLVVYSNQPNYFDVQEMRLIAALADNISFAVESHHREERRLEAEAATRSTTELLRAVADATPDAVFVKDLQGRYLLFNEAAARFVGQPVEKVLGHDDSLFFDKASLRQVQANDRKVMKSGQTETTEEVLTAGGITRTYLATKAPYRDSRGEIAGVIGISRNITERKEAEEALRSSEKRFASIYKANPAAIGINTLDTGRIIDVNDRLCEFFGWKREEVIGRTIFELNIWADPEKRASLVAQVRKTGSARDLEVQLRRGNGEIRDVLLSAEKVDMPGESEPVLIAMFTDRTERKRTEEALIASEARFRSFMAHSPAAGWIADQEGFLRYASPGYFRVFGGKRNIVGHHYRDIYAPDLVDIYLASNQRLLKERRVVEAVEPCVRADGSRGEFLVIKFPIDLPGEGLLVGGMALDITERKRSEERFRRLVESNAQGVFFYQPGGRVVEANDAFLRIINSNRDELEKGRINWIALTPPEYDDLDRQAARELAARGACAPYEKEFQRRDGTRVPVLLGAATLDNNPEEGVSFVLDITERKRLEQQFLRSQRMESVGTLAGGIAHDLNNVLGPIIMSLDLLKMKFTDEESQELLTVISSSAQRGADMVRQVLSFARGVEGRRMELQIRHLIRDIEKVATETFLKHILIRTIVAQDLWVVAGDPTQLHQVLLNLCVNARDAMPEGGTLTISAENLQIDEQFAGLHPEATPGSYVVVSVEDSGVGIPADTLDKIFDPFFTTKEVGRGTGLGLSTTLAIVKSHGGFIRVYSEPGTGTTFKVYLQALPEASAEAVAERAAEMPRGNGELILVVDDEAPVRQITQQSLQAFGYRVIVATDGSEAIATYATRGSEIAVVLTDMMMPVMDGPSTIRVLCKMNPAVRIIGASGLAANAQVAQVTQLGVKHFLPKPYTTEVLLKVLHEILHGEAKE